MRRALRAALCGTTLVFAGVVPAFAAGSTTISMAGTAPVTWSNAGSTDTALAADGGALTLSGSMKTSASTGAGTITITAPASITGTNGAPFTMSNISVTCSGSAIAGQTYVANQTPLVAGGSVTCASYAAGFNSTKINITVTFFLNDQTLKADTYSSASGFAFVATAS